MSNRSKTSPVDVIAAFEGMRIVVLGDVMLDEYVHGDVSRISPEAPVPVLEVRERVLRPGGAANAAANVASLGGSAVIVGVVGEDDAKQSLVALLETSSVEHSFVTVRGRPTTSKTRIVARGQQVVRLDQEAKAPLGADAEERLIATIEREMRTAAACIVSDYAKGVVSDRVVQAAILAARRAGRPIIVDPKARSLAKYAGATIVTPNSQELKVAADRQEMQTDEDLVLAAADVLGVLGGASLLVTRGALGMTLFVSGAAPLHLPTRAKAVYDVVGAGDTVVSTLALSLAAGASPEIAVDLANHAAGIVVSKPGTATVFREELRSAFA